MKLAKCFAILLLVSQIAFADDNQSGSRLKKIMAGYADGAQMLVAFFDTKINVDCSFQEDTVGTYRCYPVNSLNQAQTRGVFLDNQCTVLAGNIIRDPLYLKPFGKTHDFLVVYDPVAKVKSVRKFLWKPAKGRGATRYTFDRRGFCRGNTTFSKAAKFDIKMGPVINLNTFVEVVDFRQE